MLTQPWPATSSEKARGIPDRVIYYQYRHDRARRTLRGIDEQVAKAERAVDGKAPVKRNRYIQLSSATKSVNRELEQSPSISRVERLPPALAHREELPHVQTRPAGPAGVSLHAAVDRGAPDDRVRRLAVSHWIEHQTGWSIKKFVRTARRYRTIQIKAGQQILAAADPLPNDLHQAIAKISAHTAH